VRSLILSTAVKVLVPLTLLYSVFLLFRGHNDPGGGFVGGLVASAAFSLFALAEGVEASRRILRIDPRDLIPTGLAVSLASGLASLWTGGPFLTGAWYASPLPVIGKLGTPVVFDCGVYLLVLGVVLTIVFALGEE